MNRRPVATLCTATLTLLLASAAGWAGSSDLGSSPLTFAPRAPCDEDTSCPAGYWVFLAPDCQYHDLSHPPGTVVLLESGATLQCRCRLVWLLTKPEEPPTAKVSCEWIDLDD